MVNALIGEARITELPLAGGEEAIGVVAALRVTWGNAVVVMLRTSDDLIASGISARWPGQSSTNPYLAEGKARMKAMMHMQQLRQQQREFADEHKRKA